MRWANFNGERSSLVPSLPRDINGLVTDLLTSGWEPFYKRASAPEVFNPKVNVTEDKEGFTVTAEVPGVKKEDIKLNTSGDVLTLSGEKRSEVTRSDEDKEHTKAHYVERTYGSFERSFQLNAEVDEDKIDASFEDGILKVRLPKSQKAKQGVKAISIK